MLFLILVIQVALARSLVAPQDLKSTESSHEYLRNVMFELQELQTPPTGLQGFSSINQAQYLVGKRLSRYNSKALPTRVYPNVPRRTVDPMEVSSSNQQYYHVSAPIIVPDIPKSVGEPLTFTKNELAAMYQQALESGNALSYSALNDALGKGHLPSVVGEHLEIPTGQQQLYKFHFYPLKSFMDNLHNNHGYKTINELTPEPVGAFQESQKQLVLNPLFMAISGFVGMAMIFMLGVVMIPRIFGEFKSRLVHDDLLNLTKTVTEAIDNYNSTTMRPKIRGTVVGIKTRPGHGVIVKRRRKIQRVTGNTT